MRSTPGPGLLALVALGGGAGAALRAVLEQATPGHALWTVLAINVVGSFALGALPALRAVRRSPGLAAALGPGFLGGFTTVSSYALLSHDAGSPVAGAAYLAGTLVAAVGAAAAGQHLARRGAAA